jgi:hypothetical protein
MYTVRKNKVRDHPHCDKKYRKFPPQITDAADHTTPVTGISGIKYPTSVSECSATYVHISEYSRIYEYILDVKCLKFNMR